jgi:capsid protein
MSATWFDHAIATLAPRAAARRVLARQAFETLTRGYDGAAKGRRTEGWRAPGTSADTEVGVAGALLRDRMRDLVRNNPHAAKAVAVLVNNIVGAGHHAARRERGCRAGPRGRRGSSGIWADGAATRTASSTSTGCRRSLCREMVEAGEVLVRRRPRRPGDGVVPVPVQLQVLEADFLDATRNRRPRRGPGWCRGSSSTRSARRRAYWLLRRSPRRRRA